MPPLDSAMRCTICGHRPMAVTGHAVGERRASLLICPHCGQEYKVADHIPDMLLPEIRTAMSRWKIGISEAKFLRGAKPGLAEDDVISWLAKSLNVPSQVLQESRSRTMRRLLVSMAVTLEDGNLSEDQQRELFGILASELMASGYREHVADPAQASMEAVSYERYEDILLRQVMNFVLAGDQPVVLVELGSGVGRLLHQYGSGISTNDEACIYYRRLGPQLYRPDYLPNGDNLRLIVGVDFSRYMLKKSVAWLQSDRLGPLIREGRIAQLLGTIRSLRLGFDDGVLTNSVRVVCILFQTIGNQLGSDLQVEMLKKAKDIAGPDGVVFVSAFNGEAFDQQSKAYYESIVRSVGQAWYWGDDFFLSKKGVYSKWMRPDEMKRLFRQADMKQAVVLNDDMLPVFEDYARYTAVNKQIRYKRRAIIGVYADGFGKDLVKSMVRVRN